VNQSISEWADGGRIWAGRLGLIFSLQYTNRRLYKSQAAVAFMIASELISEEGRRFGIAWVCLCVALALHVADEAATDFLSVYNPTAQAIRKRFPFLPLPVFTFRVWLTGLCLGVFLALSVSPMAFRGSRFMIWLAYPFAIIMFANGLGHIGGSVYRRRLMPGVRSSPLLLLASAYLVICAEAMRHTPPAT
jgi:hypothetical protein